MLWGPEALAGFAEAAGWKGDDLVAAVALALSSSGGDDGYLDSAGAPAYRDRRGLWAIEVVDLPAPLVVNLWDPRANAAAAYGLWVGRGGSWAAFPAFGSPAYRRWLPVAADAVTSGVRVQALRPEAMPGEVIANRRRAIDALAGIGRMLAGPIAGVGRQP